MKELVSSMELILPQIEVSLFCQYLIANLDYPSSSSLPIRIQHKSHIQKQFCQESLESRQAALETTLQLVYNIMWELKTHEVIENMVIMQQLKERMHSRQKYNRLVCNCHEDSELVSATNIFCF